ncbi:MAG TPA: OmpA family protein [Cyclobacteriaceae bacterium]|jgi:outer membrane protein OmpA-like peptidoglycan-associated protein|nr:OmpA family protein [Cytophagales bacterium]HMR58660.1 OmpA family protein [Cyclobacteriaceae bacterium]HNT50666.1 OmpA family protein [Cyclobacteriaceae bacterium]HRE66172.1 OmpA family protein [Cyclobacteriaceae bacterium]HRF32137.1 OmpA family protein [Cyclobacteriaceae bacterium]
MKARWLLFGFYLCFCLQLGAQQTEELRKSIYFNGGSYEIDEEQAAMLSHWLDSIPNLLDKYQIQLISHTDPIGGKEFNQWLSHMRSQAVFQLLTEHSIPEKLISIKDWGLENPVYTNKTYRGMRLNRRVDVILYPLVY